MSNAYFQIPKPENEPILPYLLGDTARTELQEELVRQSATQIDIPLIIGGKEIKTSRQVDVVMPHNHQHLLAKCSIADEQHLNQAIAAALDAKKTWETMPFEHRAAIFLKAAELISGPYRALLNAATMLGQSKTAYQAEIDSACELADFLRFNAYNAGNVFSEQPANSKGIWNRSLYRPLEGFVLAITPFNFTAIAGNLGAAPALVGNTVLWKPSTASLLSNYYVMKIFMEAGLPNGVINFIPSSGADISSHVVSHSQLAGVHFTGSTSVFQAIWSQIGSNIANYKSYPRLVGETGGKDFVFAHKTANTDTLVAGLIRGAFEYQGQKCSAASRAFIPASIWPTVKEELLAKIAEIKVGDIIDFSSFMGAVIDKKSFSNIKGYIDRAKESSTTELLCGEYDDSKGYFVTPTVILSKTPNSESMVEEIFGPVLSIYVYEDDKLEETLKICDEASPYALTGAIYADDRQALIEMSTLLCHSAGNLYINDKPTGAVVGQQPFGGGRASGTNDKAGSTINLMRWLSVQVIKENLLPSSDISYPYMLEK